MTQRLSIVVALFATLVAVPVFAGECVVTSNDAKGGGSITEAIEKAYRGECASTDSSLHVIRFTKSGTIALSESLPPLHGVGNESLVIQASNDVHVSFLGKSYSGTAPAFHIDGNEGAVIIDGLQFENFAHTPILVTAGRTTITHCLIQNNGGDGIEVGETSSDRHILIEKNSITGNLGAGVRIRATGVTANENDIHGNRGAAILVATRAELHRNRIFGNADGIVISKNGLVPPVDLVEVSDETINNYQLIGNIGRSTAKDYPWDDAHLDLKNAEVEIFVANDTKSRQGAAFVAKSRVTDVSKRLFSITIPKPLMIDGKEIKNPIFVATLTDPEHHNTSRYSDLLDVSTKGDWDGDGISNAEEATLKTDPRLKDSDGDGLTDGEEHLHAGRIEEILKQQQKKDSQQPPPFASFKDLSQLNPIVADSDGDCLVDGLEMGAAVFERPVASSAEFSVLATPTPVLSGECTDILTAHAVDLTKITFYDSDPSHMTDPTNKDTDDDRLMDGAEDWNFNGARDKDEKGTLLETDPLNPDSDGDKLKDGDEINSSALLVDSDHDGVPDAQEIQNGGNPASCDSDNDKLPDGIENNVSNQSPATGCEGVPFNGTNFANPSVLSSSKADSDGDGLKDGDEDKNHNGWLDPDESDPTTPDTDEDGISDYIEMTGDMNHDDAADFFLGDINNGAKCAPPTSIADVDCDGLSNAQDTDSDNDGCPDRAEGLDPGSDSHGIPAAYTKDLKQCGSSAGGSSGGSSAGSSAGGSLIGGGSAKPVADESTGGAGTWNAYWAGRTDGGGDCSLLPKNEPNSQNTSVFFLAALAFSVLLTARNFLRHTS